MALIMLRLKGSIHIFIKNHAQQALIFQLGLSTSLVIFNLIGICILMILAIPITVRNLAQILFVMLIFNTFSFILIAVFQFIVTATAILQSFRGKYFRYPKIFTN